MPRPADPQRRREVLDAVIDQLAATGIGSFSLRTLAAGIGQSTRVLTHHFADKNALLTAVLARLDERQHTALRSTPGWYDPAVKVGSLVRSAWERNLGSDELAMTRLFREIDGLAAMRPTAAPRRRVRTRACRVRRLVPGPPRPARQQRPDQSDAAQQRLLKPAERLPHHRGQGTHRGRPRRAVRVDRLLRGPEGLSPCVRQVPASAVRADAVSARPFS